MVKTSNKIAKWGMGNKGPRSVESMALTAMRRVAAQIILVLAVGRETKKANF